MNVIAIAPALSSSIEPMATARLTREQSKAHTRERLLLAARRVFARHGFHGASVEEIASEAGFSTGAGDRFVSGLERVVLAVGTAFTRDDPFAVARRDVKNGSARLSGGHALRTPETRWEFTA